MSMFTELDIYMGRKPKETPVPSKSDHAWVALGYILCAVGVAAVIALLSFAALTAYNGYVRHEKGAEAGVLTDKAREQVKIARAEFEAGCYRSAIR